jgi:hypothetical protein
MQGISNSKSQFVVLNEYTSSEFQPLIKYLTEWSTAAEPSMKRKSFGGDRPILKVSQVQPNVMCDVKAKV